MSYQAVIRDASDNLITDTHKLECKSAFYKVLQAERQFMLKHRVPTTNANGLVSLEIGAGTWLKVEILPP